MIGLLAATAILLHVGPARPQWLPTDPPAKPKDFTWRYGEATEFDVHYKLVYDGSVYIGDIHCDNRCLGKKHFRHEDCDLSCDERCKVNHKVDIEPRYEPTSNTSVHDEIPKALEKIGSDLAPEWKAKKLCPDFLVEAQKLVEPVLKDPKNGLHVVLQHWNTRPCTHSYKLRTENFWRVNVEWKVFRIDTGPENRKIRVAGPTGTYTCGTLYTESFDPNLTPGYWEECKCKVLLTEDQATHDKLIEEKKKNDEEKKKLEEEEHKKAQEEHKPVFKTEKTSLPDVEMCALGTCLGSTDLDKCHFSVTCDDLNTATCTAENPCPYDVDCCINPGAICRPENPDYQTMCFVMACKLHLPAKGKVSVPLEILHGPYVTGGQVKTEGRIACIEMHKRQPQANIVYHIDMGSDVGLVKLAAMVQDEFAIGSHDQARIWIYTDHADYPSIKKLLIPSPPPGQYPALVYDVALKTNVDFTTAEYRGCIDPAYIFAKGRTTPQAETWYVSMCDKLDHASLAEKVKGEAADLQDLLGPNADDRTVQRCAATLFALTRSPNKDVALAGFELLKNGVPEGARQRIMNSSGLSGADAALDSPDPDIDTAALDVIALYKYGPAYPFVSAFAASTGNADLKKRAEEVAKSIAGRFQVSLGASAPVG